MTCLTEPCLTVYHLQVFKKVLQLVLLRLMGYHERQQSQFLRVCGLKKLTQKLELHLNLEIVDICLYFRINFISAYRDSVSVLLFINCTLNTIL